MSSAQGTSARFVILAILGKWRVWRKIQNLYMRFVDPKSEVSAPMYCFEGSPLRYSMFVWILGLTNLDQ